MFFLVGLWVIFASPYFAQGKVPYASTYQGNFFPPWSHYEQFWGPVKNNAMPDVHGQIYPWKKLTIDTWKSGEIPLWNPYSFSGNPHLANFQSAVFSPFNLLFFILPFIDAWSILILLQPLLAGLFMYLFVREIGVGRIGSLISSISFMFCGFIVVWMAYGTLGYAILYLPLALFAVERYYRSGSFKSLLLLTLTIPLSFFSGHFQISFYFLGALIFYIIFKAFIKRSVRKTAYLFISIVFGLLISTPQLIPSISLYLNSVRSELFQVGEAIPFQYLITVVAPDFFGNPVTRNDWFGHYAEWASFIGIWPLFLAIYAMARARSWRVIFFLVLGLSSLALAVNSPLSLLLVSLKLPVLSTSALSRIIVLLSFSFAVLAGFGLDQLIKDLKGNKERKSIIFLLMTVLVFFVIVWFLVLFGKVYPNDWLIVAKRNFILPTFLFFIGAFAVLAAIKQRLILPFIPYFLLLIISFDSLRFAQKWMPFDPRNLVYQDVTVIDVIKRETKGVDRVFGNLGAEVGVYYGIPLVEGYDPLYIGKYGNFLRSANNGELVKAERSVAKIERRGTYTDRALDLLGVSLVYQPIADTNQGWAYPVWDKEDRYSLIYKDDKFELYKNNMAMPRTALFYDLEVIQDGKDIIKRLYNNDFDFRKKIILEEKINTDITEGTGSARIVMYTPNKIKIEVNTSSFAFLFLSDNYYPGWRAKVNGKEEKIYRADYTFRAVLVPKGNSVVELQYNPFFNF